MILDFHAKITPQSPFYDKTLLLSSLLNGKATEIESFLQSIIFTPKKCLLKVCVSFCTDCRFSFIFQKCEQAAFTYITRAHVYLMDAIP